MTRAVLTLLLIAPALAAEAPVSDQKYERQRLELVEEVEADVAYTSRELGKKRLDSEVMAALGRVPRHEFVPADLARYAYDNRPLPIGYGQTISQPYIVAIMTDLIEPKPGSIVLELGTGSGYQAAMLAEVVEKVYSIEIVPELAEAAAERLERLGYDNIETRLGDGYHGWREHAPFDAIVVTAAAGHVPPPLIEQLKPGGRMIIPVGRPFSVQHLMLLMKSKDGEIRSKQVLPVSFVPLTGDH
jgi:protein-L-isoaspartate(D-aspartate) O-methyltransferase